MKNKKSKKADLEKRRFLFLQVGLIVAVSVSLAAFEWTVGDGVPRYALVEEDVQEDVKFDYEIPVEEETQETTVDNQPDPSVSDPDPNPEPIVVVVDPVVGDPDPNPGPIVINPGPPIGVGVGTGAPSDVPIPNVELQFKPEFPGGEKAMYEYLGKNINYPRLARESQIEGRVFVEFIIGRDGSIESTKILKGIGGGCDEEADRVVAGMPKWKPGEQFGKKVRVKYLLPIHFRLD